LKKLLRLLIFTGAAALAAVFLAGCGGKEGLALKTVNVEEISPEDYIQQGHITDPRDGNTYRIVMINGMTWMAENLNYAATGSRCRNNSESYCKEYGRLYTWDAAMNACPAGWHLPAREEWNGLIVFTGGAAKAGGRLKSKSPNWDGTDDYGFSALPAGISYIDPDIGIADAYADEDPDVSLSYWWAATQRGASSAYCYIMNAGYTFAVESHYQKNYGYSVRCLKD
jgi:uncharacterized protein (TIGR02145 family)